MDRYSLRQGLPVILDGRDIHVGLAPPNATLIENAPDGLSALLKFASIPRELSDLTAHAETLGFNMEESAALVQELIEAEIFISRWVDRNSRYSRHDLFYDLASESSGFESSDLASRRVGLVGVGGIGTNVAMQLSAAGVGQLTLMDDDTVELSNLTRQFLFNEEDLGISKVVAARKRLLEKNSTVKIDIIEEGAASADALAKIFDSSDLVIVSADTPQTITNWANEVSLATGTPFIPTGYQDTRGVVGPMVWTGNGPCFACAVKTDGISGTKDEATHTTEVVNLNLQYQAPSYGPLNSIVASFAVSDTIRYLGGLRPNLLSRRLVVDALTFENSYEEYMRSEDCPACGNQDS